MPSVVGLLEERELAARGRVEQLREEVSWQVRSPGRQHTALTRDIRPPPLPVTFTTAVMPLGAQVRALGGRRPWPDSSAKHRQASCPLTLVPPPVRPS